MENVVKSRLRKGESILWQGAPEPFPLIEKGNRMSVLRLWLITLAAVGGLILAYCSQNAESETHIVVIMALIGLLIASVPFIERVRVSRQHFFLTNERAFLVVGAKKVYEMELAAIDEVEQVDDVANHACIAMGSSIFEYMREEMRWRACHPKINMSDAENRGRVDGMVFYDVADAEGAMKILNKRGQKIEA